MPDDLGRRAGSRDRHDRGPQRRRRPSGPASPGRRTTSRSAAIARPARSCRPRRCSKQTPKPTDQQIIDAMSGNICRCGTYQRIRQAIKSAAEVGGMTENCQSEPARCTQRRRPDLGAGPRFPCRVPQVPRCRGCRGSAVSAECLSFALTSTGLVTIVASRSEMGTGIKTDLPLVLADELEADWNRVKVVQGQGDPKYGDQNTDGSRSTWQFFGPMRMAGATARQMLETAAAQTWSVPVGACQAQNGFVVHPASGRKLAFGDLAKVGGDDAGAAVEPGAAQGPKRLALYRQTARDRRSQGHRPGPRDLWHRRRRSGHEIRLDRALPGLWRQGQILRRQRMRCRSPASSASSRSRRPRCRPGSSHWAASRSSPTTPGRRSRAGSASRSSGIPGPMPATTAPPTAPSSKRRPRAGQGRARPRRCRRRAGVSRQARISRLFCPASGACPDGSAHRRGALGRQYLRDLVADAKPARRYARPSPRSSASTKPTSPSM